MKSKSDRFRYVLSAEHATNWLPKVSLSQPDLLSLLNTHRAYDIGVTELSQQIQTELKCPLVLGKVSRLLVDLNRSSDKPNVFGPAAKHFSEAEKNFLLKRYHQAHFDRVTRACKSELLRGVVRLLSIHSFTPIWRTKKRRVDIGLLDHFLAPEQRKFTLKLKSALKKALPDLSIHLNEPYRGHTDAIVHPINSYFEPQDCFGICLEVNQRLLLDRRSQMKMAKGICEALSTITP